MSKQLLIGFCFTFFTVYNGVAQAELDSRVKIVKMEDFERLEADRSELSYTAVVLRSSIPSNYHNVYALLNGDTIAFQKDPHLDNQAGFYYSTMVHLPDSASGLTFKGKDDRSFLEVILIDGRGGLPFPQRKKTNFLLNECDLPAIVSQSEWRQDLPAPIYNRNFTESKHLIVHHSAGTFTTNDFQQVVRNIYVLHTQVNGWSDIGYNYLIAPDGTIFAGRDPAGGPQDQVLGAHFCGSNSGTMGICLLGNYEIEPATDLLIESLQQLLAWKAHKDGLNMQESDFHPLDADLPLLAGHRDGCNTLCPGENVYMQLPLLRQQVAGIVRSCADSIEGEQPGAEEPVSLAFNPRRPGTIFPNPIRENFTFEVSMTRNRQKNIYSVRIYNPFGLNIPRLELVFSEHSMEVKLPESLAAGVYHLEVFMIGDESWTRRFIIE